MKDRALFVNQRIRRLAFALGEQFSSLGRRTGRRAEAGRPKSPPVLAKESAAVFFSCCGTPGFPDENFIKKRAKSKKMVARIFCLWYN